MFTTIADTGDSAIARIDKDSPVIGISTSDSDISGGTNGTYSMSFAITADQVVPTLNSADSYQLVQVMDNGDAADTLEAIDAGNITATLSDDSDTEATTISYTVDLSDLSGTQRADIEGFTLIRNGADTLIDRSGNQPTKADGTTLIAGTGADLLPRLISGVSGGEVSVVVTIERTPPEITVLALGEEAVPSDDDVNEYTLRFRVESSSEPVPDLDDPSSYVVMRRLISDETMLEPLATASVTPGDVDAGNQNTTLSFTVTLDSIDITRDTNGFTLGRAGPDNACNLCDASGNAPVKGGDDHGSGLIAVDMRIDDAPEALLARDTTNPQITIAAGADGAVPQGAEGSGSYQMTFTVTSANDDAVPTLDMDTSYQLVRIFKNSTATEVITNPTVVVSNDSSDTEAELTYTTTLTTRIPDTESFTLARATDMNSLLDASGNIPVKSDGTTITAGSFIASVNDDGQVDDENAIAVLPLSDDATLSSLELTAMINSASINIPLNPEEFDGGVLIYMASVIFSVDSVNVRPTASSDYVTAITVNSNDLANDGTSSVPLNDPGTNAETEVEVKVVAEDGITSQTYTITITRDTAASNVATLSSLTLEGIPSFGFDPTTTTQAVMVPFRINETTVMATATHPGATIAIALDGTSQEDPNIELAVGDNTIMIEVTPEDSSTPTTYTLTITRERSDDATLASLSLEGIPLSDFDPATFTYEITTGRIDQTTVTAMVSFSDPDGATITGLTVDDATPDDFTAGSDIVTGGITLTGDNEIVITVTAADDTTTQAYTLNITRSDNATLASLSLEGIPLSDFDPATFTYEIMAGDITQTTVTAMVSFSDPGGATITGLTVDDAIPDDFTAGSDIETGGITLTGNNVIVITVTAADGTAQDYTLNITRSNDATLASLSLEGVPSFDFDSATFTYDIMTGDITQTTVTAMVSFSDPGGATITGLTVDDTTPDNFTAGSDIETGGITLTGDNEIVITVTAADDTTTQAYTLNITRSNDATLASLSLEGVPSFDFDSATFTYDIMTGDITQTTVTAMVSFSDPGGATITGLMVDDTTPDNFTAGSDIETGGITLTGDNEIVITVTAADGTTTQAYTLNITRSDDATLASLSLEGVPSFDFDSATFTYDIMTGDITQTTVTAMVSFSDPGGATITGLMVDDTTPDNFTAGSDIETGGITLTGDNEIVITVTAADGTTTQAYTLNITRSDDATLASLSLEGVPSFDFDPATFTYDIMTGDITQTTVTAMVSFSDPNGATITGLTVDDATPDDFTAGSDIETGGITLTGDNEIVITVTAADGTTTQAYTLNITRSDDATLASLSLDGIPFEFNSSTSTYELISGDITQTTVTAMVSFSDPNGATITGLTVDDATPDNFTAGSDIETGGIELTGNNVIVITVTAADGTAQDYTLNIKRSSAIRLRIKVFLEGPLQ